VIQAMIGGLSRLMDHATEDRESRALLSNFIWRSTLALGARKQSSFLLICIVIALLSLNLISEVWAQPPRGIDRSIIAVDTGGNGFTTPTQKFLTFKQGSEGNVKPTYVNNTSIEDGRPVFSGVTSVAVSPVTLQNFLTYDGSSEVLGFSPTVNGRDYPASVIFGTQSGLASPFDIAFDSMATPAIDTTGQLYVTNQFGQYGFGSVTIYDGPSGSQVPNLIIEASSNGDNTGLFNPSGLFVDEATLTACVGPAPNDDLCDPTTGAAMITVPTRRIWVINSGSVSIYAPELADAVASVTGVPYCIEDPSFPNDCNEPPLGGFFPTMAKANDQFSALYLTLNSDVTQAYITGGCGLNFSQSDPLQFGGVRTFALSSQPVCVVPAANDNTQCVVAVENYEVATNTFNPQIVVPGFKDFTFCPSGINTASVDGRDEIFVAGTPAKQLRSTPGEFSYHQGHAELLEFDSGLATNGDVSPIAIVTGPRTELQPADFFGQIATAISPPSLVK
jgi:hypothetical protein